MSSTCYSEIYDSYCENNYANGQCDDGCNVPECGHDGLDCDKGQPDPAFGLLILVVRISYEDMQKENVSRKFLRDLGQALNTVVFFDLDENGNNRIEPYDPLSNSIYNRRRRQVAGLVLEWYVYSLSLIQLC